MLYTISNDTVSATISSLGAELKSLKNIAHNDEYIWQGDTKIWQGSAPILFPIIGRLKNGQYQFDGKTYQLNKHGFARTSEFAVENQQSNAVTLGIKANDQTKQNYPFDFVLLVTFALSADGLTVSYQVKNSGKETMYFTLGSHPALRLPLDNSALSDYFISFEQPETLDCYYLENDLLCDNPIKAYLNNENTLPITSNLFENDALIFKEISSTKVHLNHKKTGHRLTMETGGAPHFGLWAKPNAPFICFEPWYSHDDPANTNGELINKPGMMRLHSNETFETCYTLSLSQSINHSHTT